MGQNADSQDSGEGKRLIARKALAIALLGVILLASLLACGFFVIKTLHRTQQRRVAMAAYERGDYKTAEHLLLRYVQKDPNSEPEFVALAKIYHEFGNTGTEAQMWQRASSLNPLNEEYRENMLTSAVKSASYGLLHGILGRRIKVGETLSGRELFYYVIASCRVGYPKDGEDAYKKALEADPEAFSRSELGQMAEFFVKYNSLSEWEKNDFLDQARESEDPVVRFEAICSAMVLAAKGGAENADKVEKMLKELVETNYFAGTPFLADFLFAQNRFPEVVAVAEPYLKMIDDANVALLYAESCVFSEELEKLVELEKSLREKTGVMPLMADYCRILIAFMGDDEEELAANVRKSGKLVTSPLSRLIRLRVAMEQESFNEILSVSREIFSNPPFYDLCNRTLLLCMDYLMKELQKPEKRKDPSDLVELAKVLSGYLKDNWILTEIILFDQYRKGLAKEADLLAALEQFPEDLLLRQITAEFLVYNGKAEQALSIIEEALEAGVADRKLDFLHMVALDQLERHDEAATIFRQLVEQSEFDLDLLSNYFDFCRNHERGADLLSMAEKLSGAGDEKLKPFADFFRAAALLLDDDEEKTQEALKLLAATPNDNPEFTFYAANRLCEADMLDEAEAKYMAIRNTYSIPSLVYVNLSEVYDAKGETKKALETAKEAFDLEKKSMLPAFIYAKRLSEAERYQEAVDVLKFPRRAVNYREDIVELWADCMKKVIEKSMADRRYLQAEEQCKHLLVIVPDDEFGREKLEKVREILLPKKDGNAADDIVATPAA